MGKRLSTKHRKQARDKARAYSETKLPQEHKVARERSTRAKAKKAYRMA